ncbi:MAG TPA: catalase, partial [Pseudomonas sp.]|nr:catalase [Pseudomonas sp.]
AYKFVNEQGETHYVKFRWKSLQGLKNLDPKENEAMQGKDYSHLSRDL